MSEDVKYLSEQEILEWQRQKRAEWLRDKKLIEEGKLRPEDLSWANRFGWGTGEIDFSRAEAALEDEDDSSEVHD